MKKLLPLFVLAALLTACGASEQEKAAAQSEAEERVNQIIEDVKASQKESPAVKVDTAKLDSGMAEPAHDHEGDDHAEGNHDH